PEKLFLVQCRIKLLVALLKVLHHHNRFSNSALSRTACGQFSAAAEPGGLPHWPIASRGLACHGLIPNKRSSSSRSPRRKASTIECGMCILSAPRLASCCKSWRDFAGYVCRF